MIRLYRIIEVIAKCILYYETKVISVSDNNKDTYNHFLKYIPKSEIKEKDSKNLKIEFKNGSTITCIKPETQQEVIRGKRAELPMWLDPSDYYLSHMTQEEFDEILKPYMRKEL